MEIHFSSPYNFGAIPRGLSEYKKAKVVIVPIPYDATTSYKSGTRDGPMAIITASRNMELFDEETKKNISDVGICTLDEIDIVVDPEKMANRVYEVSKQLVNDEKNIILLGGEHSLSSGVVKALKEKYNDLSVLKLDAHSDLRDENGETKHDHGCAGRRMMDHCPVVHVGVRSMCEEESEFIEKNKIKMFKASEINEAIDSLSENVYLSIDLDALDPSIMPAVGTPEPGGIKWDELMNILKEVAKNKKVVGCDVVELCPIPGNIAPDFSAAIIVKKIISNFF